MSSTCKKCGVVTGVLSDGLCKACLSIHMDTVVRDPVGKDDVSDPARPGTNDSAATHFGEYKLIEEIGRGGMGVIYKARHVKLNRITALKTIIGGRFSSAADLQRFHIEAEAAAKLDHPGIVPVYEIGEVDGQAFFAMKFIAGGSLSDQLPQFQSDSRAAMRLLAGVARAVHHAHQRGILHRDLKPANILIDEDGQPLVTDLGLAKNTGDGSNLTDTGAILGTPSYMPPEQASGSAVVTTAADIYSLGAIMYELLTGVPPFRGSTAVETLLKVREGDLIPPQKAQPNVDRDLALICLKCLERSPDSRYESAQDLAADLEAWLDNEPISIRAPSVVAQARRWFQRNRRTAYLIFAVLMGIAVTMPFALTFAIGGDFSEVYDQFPADQRPWLFSFETIPEWLNRTLGLTLIFLLWPTVGFLNGVVTRPSSFWGAVRSGFVTSALLVAVFSAILGWMPLLRITNDDATVQALTEAIWQRDGQSPDDALQKVEARYAGLDEIPRHERAAVVADRLRSDRLAAAPGALLIILVIECVLLIPVIYGTAISYALLGRGHRIWVAYLRYTAAWWLAGITFLAGLNTLHRTLEPGDSGARLQPTIEVVAAVVGSLLLWLTLRRWKRSSVPTPATTIIAGAS